VGIPDIDIIYRDEQLVVVYKPTGLLFHRHGWDRQGPFLLQTLRNQIGQTLYPVHRLDRPTAGLVLFALNPQSANFLAQAFRNHQINKTYWAVCRGYVPQLTIIDYPLKNPDNGIVQTAITLLSIQTCCEIPIPSPPHPSSRFSLVKLKPLHGRTHQLRRHMAHLRHPIIGDIKHGDGRQNRIFRDHFQINRLLLCALSLKLPHPSGGYLHIYARPDEGFTQVTDQLFQKKSSQVSTWPQQHLVRQFLR